jgi:hypothetical protein
MRVPDPPQLTAELRARLARLLCMCGSDHDGEMLTAARMAARLVRGLGLTWPSVIGISALNDANTENYGDPLRRFASLDACCRFVLTRTPMLTAWERAFTVKLPGFTKLSPKQLGVLRALVVRALDAGGTT